ncbi:hypothetical protein SPAB_01598 [Salmonella enterica subsp. enterica serovar Paratyphi B str. SPB7]|uniref:Uncharacterized protein n=1 Tax=Salmonella paratyphi B (strain ATCC BAA-1250 / SPB7) TaxID=1016998 RepID=A0A6C6Z1K3_SALPB|nr:hypothetical protein SPAB_01598 [Salmonella enterica subsp. enterica serovar Paratyphi B str. SPB7]
MALQPSISTSIPLLTPERRASSSSDIFFWLRNCLIRWETASFIVLTSAPAVVDKLTFLVIGRYHRRK